MNRAERRRQQKLAESAAGNTNPGEAPAIRQSLELAVQHHNAGDLPKAEALYQQILEADPDQPAALHFLGVIAHQQGKSDVAAELIAKAVAVNPDDADAHHNLGLALKKLGRLEDAVASYHKALALNPDLVPALGSLGLALQALGRLDDAVASYHKAIALNPDFAPAHNDLGNALKELGRSEEAAASYAKAIALNPDDVGAHSNLGVALQALGRLEDAVASFDKAIALNPDLAPLHNNLGNAFKVLGRLDEAIASYRKALALNPDDLDARSNLLMNTQYQPGVTVARLKSLHAEWDERFGIPLRREWREHENRRDPEKRLRIGFVSPDFGHHPVGYFLIRLLENKPRNEIGDEVELVCYSDREPDEMTARIKDACDAWTDVRGQTDEALAERIRADGVDILFDITGHTAKNRLLSFARKPAPIQVSWGIGYPAATGLSAIDYLLCDIHHVAEKEDSSYSGKIIRMPDGMFCYDPPPYAPGVAPPPAERNGFITFGSFSGPAKINDATMDAWMKILEGVPESRLVLKYRGIDDAATKARLLSPLDARGLDASRLIFEGWSPHAELLGRYHDIDIALDTFPYSGGLTTCEALWMGVAVITVPGETPAGRHALSHLSNIGLAELAAEDEAGYVELAVELAGDLPRLASLRAGLRDRMAKSPLCDGPKFARHFTDEMRTIWRVWCGEQGG